MQVKENQRITFLAYYELDELINRAFSPEKRYEFFVDALGGNYSNYANYVYHVEGGKPPEQKEELVAAALSHFSGEDADINGIWEILEALVYLGHLKPGYIIVDGSW